MGRAQGLVPGIDGLDLRQIQLRIADYGVIGKSSAIGTRHKESVEGGKIWAPHCAEEVDNWAAFLPQLYRLYTVVTDTARNPYADLSVEGKGLEACYGYIGKAPR